MKSIFNHDFAYLIGNFMADGSFYSTGRGYRFEFVDGSPYEDELKYSLQHIQKIKQILEKFLDVKIPKIISKGNQFILKFRNKNLAELFTKKLNIFPGKKHKIVDILPIYISSNYEKDFWIGYLDGDGSLARKSKKISVESMSQKMIDSFSNFLKANDIFFSKYKSKRDKNYSHVIVIRSISFRNFASKVGFRHPLKSKLLSKKLKDKDFFVKNEINVKKGIIDYINIFDSTVFIEKGRELLIKYGETKYTRPNINFQKLVLLMQKKELKKKEILKEINNYRFKKSKGSINSVCLPLYIERDLIKISKFVRIREGGITFSKRYIEAFNEDFNKILQLTENIFDLKPKFTNKNEPLFCSGVLSDFFNKIIKRKNK